MTKEAKKPKGGYDPTPLNPSEKTTYTVRFVFHSAADLPIGDVLQAASDPYVFATLGARGGPTGRYGARHSTDPHLTFRSATAHVTTHPQWEAEWVVAGVPSSGAELKVFVYDEDMGTHDDRLGSARLVTGQLSEDWKCERRPVELKRRGLTLLPTVLDAVLIPCIGSSGHDPTITISAEVLGKTEDNCGKAYTISSFWFIHYSPLFGAITGVNAIAGQGNDEKMVKNFAANQLQLCGPVPNELYHRYIDFSPFMPLMFEKRGLIGHFMHRTMHRQHRLVYHFDPDTEYGRLPGPGKQMAQRFLDMVAWGEGYRIFTYVITLDGLMRFTQTGKEFAVDLLSKHVMHSDVHIYIAFSGEFLVRRWKGRGRGISTANDTTENGTADNDHGTSGAANAGSQAGGVGDGDGDGPLGVVNEKGTAKIDHSAPSHSMTQPPRDADTSEAVVDPHLHNHDLPNDTTEGEGQSDAPNAADGPGVVAAHLPDSRKQSRRRRQRQRTQDVDGHPYEVTGLHGRKDNGTLDPAAYELVIDNDSGTYRPNDKLLPLLQAFLAANYVGLHVTAASCHDEAHQKLKSERREECLKLNKGRVYALSESDLSSAASDSEDEGGRPHRRTKDKAFDFLIDPKGEAKDKFGHKHHTDEGEAGPAGQHVN